MRNLRKLTAAVLAIALVLTSMTAAFAAETATTPVNGDKAIVLNELGLYAGISDKEFDPDLESNLTRQQSTVLLLKLFGLADEAKALTDEEVATALKGFTDAEKVSGWAENSIAYAVTNNIMSGMSDTTIEPNALIKGYDFATLIVKAMGYTVEDHLLGVTQLSKVTGSKVTDEFGTTDLTRDAAVGYMYGTLTAQTKLGSTVIANLVAGNPAIADKAIADGLYTPVNTTLVVDSVMAVANNKVKVELKDAAEASATDFAIVKKDTTTAVAVKSVAKESDKIYVLETEALTGGTKYTLTANAKSVNFTGIAADTTVPTIVKVSGKDLNKFEVEYSDKMDFDTVTDIANYTFDKSVKVVKAELNGDRNKVTLYTDAAKRNVIYTVTIQNVTNSDGKVISKASRKVTAIEDTLVPKLAGVKVQNNRMLIITFTENSGMDKASAETLANYSINDLNVLTATAYDVTPDDDLFETVVLTTDEQTANKSYTLTVENLVDAAVKANPLGKTTRTFRGATADKTSPTVKLGDGIKSYNNNEVEIDFTENNAMSVDSLEDISNYSITYGSAGDVLEVISAKAASTTYPDLYKNRKVTLTTAPQEFPKTYKVEVKGVQDEFGNALKTKGGSTTAYTTYSLKASDVDTVPPTVASVKYISDTRIDLTFVEPLKESIAEDPTNYAINKDIGAPIKAELKDDKRVELTTQKLSANTTYEITINNVEDKYTNAMQNAVSKFVATSGDLDLSAPSINYIQASNTREIQVNFDESISDQPDTITVSEFSDTAFTGVTHTFNYAGKMDDKKTLVYNSSTDLLPGSYKIQAGSSTLVGGNTVFKDGAGNKLAITALVTAPAIADRYAFDATDSENDTPKVQYIEQVNVKKLKVVFTEPVKAKPVVTGATGKLTKLDTDDGDDYFSEWYYETTYKILVDKTYPIDFGSYAVDTNGALVQDINLSTGEDAATTVFTGYLEDSADPVISTVEATSNRKIVITYDEDLSAAGSYKILKLNETTGNKDYWTTLPGSKDGSKVTITTPSKLSSATTYYLEVVSGATDLAGNREDTSSTQYDFPGSDVVVNDFVNGVSIVNAELIKVVATSNMASVLVTTTDTIGTTTTTTAIGFSAPATADDELEVALWAPALSGKSYNVKVEYADTSIADSNYTFSGITPDIGLELVSTGANSATLDFIDAEIDSYTYEVVTYDTNLILDGIAGTSEVVFNDVSAVMNLSANEVVYVIVRNSSGMVVYAQQVTIK